jgi:glyoxylase I family protein
VPDIDGTPSVIGRVYFSRSFPDPRSGRLGGNEKEVAVRIKLTSIMVDDQDKALRFYRDVLGFQKKHEIPVGEYKWLTVVSPEGPDDLELSLEPNANPAAKVFQEAMFKQGIPLAAFEVPDIQSDYERLRRHGVAFTREPTRTGPVTIAVFSDTCGNLIQLYQPS